MRDLLWTRGGWNAVARRDLPAPSVQPSDVGATAGELLLWFAENPADADAEVWGKRIVRSLEVAADAGKTAIPQPPPRVPPIAPTRQRNGLSPAECPVAVLHAAQRAFPENDRVGIPPFAERSPLRARGLLVRSIS
ncbi:hypothetical protein [Amycolatopsis sp. NBC_01480]|uniref:hypothetical protein n=1 Tax=Amycolatopsis sp. NBC_01480 TaxID=2903562 RepID=UPI002E2DB907|nr:hypothetical protein [Amycolatopsis sp. NBC_01480]